MRIRMMVFVTLLLALLPVTTQAASSRFVDVPEDHVSESRRDYAAISYLANAGIISGYDDTHFGPSLPLRRGELLKLALYQQAAAHKISSSGNDVPFSDVAGHSLLPYIAYAYKQGIAKGYDDGTFRPDNSVTKAEAVKMLLLAQGIEPDYSDITQSYGLAWNSDLIGYLNRAVTLKYVYDGGIGIDGMQIASRSYAAMVLYDSIINPPLDKKSANPTMSLSSSNPCTFTAHSIEEALKNPTGVCELAIEGVPLTTLPPEIGTLVNVKKIVLIDDSLATLPPEIGTLKKLRELHLTRNKLTSLPASIGELSSLEILKLDVNNLVSLPVEIKNLQNLQQLNLMGNPFTIFPKEVIAIPNLKQLVMSGMYTTLPPEIGLMHALESLDLTDSVEELPAEIGQLKNLTYLGKFGKLKKVPAEIGNLGNLKTLNLSDTYVTELPSEITKLHALEVLAIARTPITAFPSGMSELKNLKIVRIYLSGISKSVADQLREEIPWARVP